MTVRRDLRRSVSGASLGFYECEFGLDVSRLFLEDVIIQMRFGGSLMVCFPARGVRQWHRTDCATGKANRGAGIPNFVQRVLNQPIRPRYREPLPGAADQ